MLMVATGILFSIFVLNVVLGSATGKPFLGDVGEMLVLFAAAVAFVAKILSVEAAEKRKVAEQSPKGGQDNG